VKPRYPSYLKILDLCTGSGCISLLLNSVLSKYSGHVQIHGWDISRDAIALAKENWAHNIQLGHVKESADKRVRFEVVDIFDDGDKLQEILLKQSHRNLKKADVNIIIANPPYISQEAFETETTRSVRNWEPKLALVPEKRPISDVFEHPPSEVLKAVETTDAADIFYQRLLVLHSDVFKSQVLLMEIGDDAQALRVAKTALAYCHSRTTRKRNHVEVWRDSPDTGEYEELQIGEHMVPVRGSGAIRAVVLLKYRRSTPAGQISKLRPAASKRRKTKLGHT
jgi:methylase of polypeptide subunit release factors